MEKRITTILLAIIGLAFISFMANDSVILRFKPTVGKTITCQTKSAQIISMNVQGQSMNTSQTIDSKMELTVKEATADSIFCEAQTKSIKLTNSTMGMTMTYDSEHPEKTSPMLAGAVKAYEEALNKKMQVVMDPLGNTLKVDVDNIPNISVIFPEEAVSVGSQWTTDYTQVISEVNVNVTTTYTVTKITKKETSVSFESTLSSSLVNGTNEGTMVIENATGLAKSSTVKTNMDMTISEQGLSIPATINGTTTTTFE